MPEDHRSTVKYATDAVLERKLEKIHYIYFRIPQFKYMKL